MSVSQLARSISASPTLRLNEQARLLREKGEPVVHLGVGEPKNRAPLSAILSSAARLRDGDVKYAPTDGLPSLKRAILRYTEDYYGRQAAPENVIVSTGAKQSIYNALVSIVDPQDEVIILAPYWVSYPEMVRMVYGVPVIVTGEDGRYQPRIEEVEAALSSATKAIIVNSPNNPSGVIYPPELIRALVDLAERNGLYLIMDDIYHRLVFDGQQPPSVYALTEQDIDASKIIVINGVSKLYGMTGFRIGWAVANRRLVEVMTNIQGQITTCPSPVMQAGAEGALMGVQNAVESLRLTIQNNRDVMITELNAMEGVRVVKPAGTFYCLPDFRAYSNDSCELADFLLRKALVVTVPGREFGAEGHLRLSYAGSLKDIIEGVKRIRWALDPSAPNEIFLGDRKLVRDWL